MSAALRGQTTNLVSGAGWEYSRTRPPGWPGEDTTGQAPWEMYERGGILPTMYNMFFVPNAYAGMQSQRQKITLWAGFKREPKFPQVWLRKRFTVPRKAVGAVSAAPLQRIERDEDTQGVQSAQ